MSWKKVKLSDITDNLDSLRVPLNETERRTKEKDGKYPYVGANNILGYINEYIFDQKILCIAEDGGSWGKNQKCSFILNEKCWVNNHAHVLVAKNGASLDYLKHYLNYADLNSYITGTTRGKLTKSALNSIQVPLPSDSTQQKIASILDKADELRRKDHQLLAKYDELLQSIFYQMFGDPVKNEKGWNEKLLKDCVYIKGGGTPNTSVDEYYNGNIPWISPKDMKSRFISDSIDKITELAIENSSAKLIDPRSVLLVIRSGILKKSLPIGLNLLPVAINQDMKALQCKEFLNPVFLMFQLELASSQILQTVRGTTADNISSDVIKNTRLIIPSIGKQQEFEKKITATSKLIEIMKKQVIQSEFLFQSLLQKAFKGELVS